MARYECFINPEVVEAAREWFELMSDAAILEIFVWIFSFTVACLAILVYLVTKFNKKMFKKSIKK